MICPEIAEAGEALIAIDSQSESSIDDGAFVNNKSIVRLAARFVAAIEANSESMTNELIERANRFECAFQSLAAGHENGSAIKGGTTGAQGILSLVKFPYKNSGRSKLLLRRHNSIGQRTASAEAPALPQEILDCYRVRYPQLLDAIEQAEAIHAAQMTNNKSTPGLLEPYVILRAKLRRLIDDDTRFGLWGCFLLRKCRHAQAKIHATSETKELLIVCGMAPQLDALKRAANRLISSGATVSTGGVVAESTAPAATEGGDQEDSSSATVSVGDKTTEIAASAATEEQPRSKPRRSWVLAHKAYELAASCLPGKRITDELAYDWLVDHGPTEYELPKLTTWSRYLRGYRKFTGTQLNSPRGARSGRSVVRRKDT